MKNSENSVIRCNQPLVSILTLKGYFSTKAIPVISFLLLIINDNLQSQNIPYGLNDKNVNTSDANIYYEVCGEGKPIILLHGGYAYIDQYNTYIPVLSKKFKVITVASDGPEENALARDLLREHIEINTTLPYKYYNKFIYSGNRFIVIYKPINSRLFYPAGCFY